MLMHKEQDLAGKLMTPAEAVRRFIPGGAQITLGGFTIARNAMALVHEIIRQKIRDLHVVCHSHGQGLDLLIGAGCVAKLEIAYSGNGRFAPTCIRFRKAVERGEIALEDYSNNQMSLRFLAGALGIPFIPTKSGLGTDILKKEGFSPEVRRGRKTAPEKSILLQNPFAEKSDPVVLLPALTPDVALIHAQQVGEDGTVRIRGLSFADIEQAKSADAVIVTCEEVVPARLAPQRPGPKLPAALSHRRRRPGPLRRPPHRLPVLLRLRRRASEPLQADGQGRRPFRAVSGRVGLRGQAITTSTSTGSAGSDSPRIRTDADLGVPEGAGEELRWERACPYTNQEMMTISASRLVQNGDILFAGNGDLDAGGHGGQTDPCPRGRRLLRDGEHRSRHWRSCPWPWRIRGSWPAPASIRG